MHLDILVNNAGITRDSLLPKMTDEAWVEVIQTNLNGCFFCTSAAIPYMSAQSYGRIVNITFDERPGRRDGPGQLQRQQRRHHRLHAHRGRRTRPLRHHGQRGVARLHRDRHVQRRAGRVCRRRSRRRSRWPALRSPEEIAKAVLFLVADGDYITGQQIGVNGGAFM